MDAFKLQAVTDSEGTPEDAEGSGWRIPGAAAVCEPPALPSSAAWPWLCSLL